MVNSNRNVGNCKINKNKNDNKRKDSKRKVGKEYCVWFNYSLCENLMYVIFIQKSYIYYYNNFAKMSKNHILKGKIIIKNFYNDFYWYTNICYLTLSS